MASTIHNILGAMQGELQSLAAKKLGRPLTAAEAERISQLQSLTAIEALAKRFGDPKTSASDVATALTEQGS